MDEKGAAQRSDGQVSPVDGECQSSDDFSAEKLSAVTSDCHCPQIEQVAQLDPDLVQHVYG